MMEYDYIINKPELNEETLAHYGVKGMKWKHRKARMKTAANGVLIKARRKLKGMSADEISMNNGKFTFKRHDNGKALSTTRPYGNRVYNGERELYNNGYAEKANALISGNDAGIEAGRERVRKKKNAMRGDKRY